jgi:hypothetical protein
VGSMNDCRERRPTELALEREQSFDKPRRTGRAAARRPATVR